MQQFTVEANESGKRLVRVLTKRYPGVPAYRFQKALKNKDIRIDAERPRSDVLLLEGQCVQIFLPEEILLAEPIERNAAYSIVYEDRSVLIVNKAPGITVHPGKDTPVGSTLIEKLRDQYKNQELTLAHRLDRNTGGLVLLAKSKVALGKLNEVLKQDQIVKRYRCLVRGIPEIGEEVRLSDGDLMYETRAFWERPRHADQVYVHSEQRPGDLPMITRYRVRQVYTDLSAIGEPIAELEVELVTGRTHQIRAHFAFLGHPIVGDGKYGRNEFNLLFRTPLGGKLQHQQLFATSLLFGQKLPDGLQGLAGKTFKIDPPYEIAGLR